MELTPEQQELIPVIKEKWMNRMSTPIDNDKAVAAITAVYKEAGLTAPEFFFCESPLTAVYQIYDRKISDGIKEGKPLNPSKRKEDLATIADEALLYEWGQSWCALYELAKLLGVDFDEEKYTLYYNYCWDVQTIFPYEEACFVCARPISIKWDGEVLHNESGPAVEYTCGWKIWSIEGITLDEQIVMHPETQTIAQMNDEPNEEIKRIRINRYGWSNYLTDMKAEVIDFQVIRPATNGSTPWMESLFKTERYTVLCTFDPSTGRPYSLEVPPGTATCNAAQEFLLGAQHWKNDLELDIVETYPALRT